jgi:hypothetical protein
MENKMLNQIDQAVSILNNKNIPFNERLSIIMNSGLFSEKSMRKYAVWCAKQVQGLMYSSNVEVLEKIEDNIDNEAELANLAKEAYNSVHNQAGAVVCRAAKASAYEAACSTAKEAARVAAYEAAFKAAFSANHVNQWNDAWDKTYNKVLSEAEKAQEEKLRKMLTAATVDAFLFH